MPYDPPTEDGPDPDQQRDEAWDRKHLGAAPCRVHGITRCTICHPAVVFVDTAPPEKKGAVAVFVDGDPAGCKCTGRCELWKEGADPDKYGRVYRDGTSWDAHRLAYIDAYGVPPTGYHVHHLCGVRACVRLDHLAAVSVSDHWRAHNRVPPKWQLEKTECPKGHPYDEENTYTHNGKRFCRACHRESARRRAMARRTTP
jgi:hypothetical protein